KSTGFYHMLEYRMEGENMVLAEMEGPGAIVRIWSASPRQGHIKVFIDGAEKPVLDMPFRDYFSTESIPAYRYSGLVYETKARGFNNYVPITFQKSIKIIATPEWGQYYHFNYIKFPDNTTVETFQPDPPQNGTKALQEVNKKLTQSLGKPVANYKNTKTENITIKLAPGEKKSVWQMNGARAITQFKIDPQEISEDQMEKALRLTTLHMHWDGSTDPAVWSPLGDFFGSAPGYNQYQTYPMGMNDGWMYSNWYMPFAKGAEIFLHNQSEEEVTLKIELSHASLQGNANQYSRFHAKWHRDLEEVPEAQWPDWKVLETSGSGRFVGMYLLVWNPKGGSCKAYAGPGQHWWGEGDEKFFVDGEKFPSTFGTGTEDYFGYAWCIPNYFEHAFHSQNYTEDNMGYQSMNRWQVIDNVPFQESFDAYLEKYFPNHWPTQYATVAYWYLSPEGKDPLGIIPAEELYGWEIPFQAFQASNAVEGEQLEVEKNTGGWFGNDIFAHENLYDRVSGHKLMQWSAKEKGENELVVKFSWPQSGEYQVKANVLPVKAGGEFRVFLNEEPLPTSLDMHATTDDPTVKVVDLGTAKLKGGENKVRFKYLEDQSQGLILALDYLQFVPVAKN
ncbi:MAG: glycoside hydrolase family 172 protein, partial [Cyclobacteriaceae bacterium]